MIVKDRKYRMVLNEQVLRTYARQEMRRSITESIDSMKHFSYGEGYDIFLSHSSLDQELTCALYDLFTQNGFKVYLDYEDNGLNPDKVTSATGKRLRNKLKRCKCLAYIATSNITKSKWCPWELGLFDGISNGMCCILPIVKESGKSRFNGREYLGMYPYLTYTKYATSDEWTFWIENPENPKKYTTLKAWLTGEKLKNHD